MQVLDRTTENTEKPLGVSGITVMRHMVKAKGYIDELQRVRDVTRDELLQDTPPYKVDGWQYMLDAGIFSEEEIYKPIIEELKSALANEEPLAESEAFSLYSNYLYYLIDRDRKGYNSLVRAFKDFVSMDTGISRGLEVFKIFACSAAGENVLEYLNNNVNENLTQINSQDLEALLPIILHLTFLSITEFIANVQRYIEKLLNSIPELASSFQPILLNIARKSRMHANWAINISNKYPELSGTAQEVQYIIEEEYLDENLEPMILDATYAFEILKSNSTFEIKNYNQILAALRYLVNEKHFDTVFQYLDAQDQIGKDILLNDINLLQALYNGYGINGEFKDLVESVFPDPDLENNADMYINNLRTALVASVNNDIHTVLRNKSEAKKMIQGLTDVIQDLSLQELRFLQLIILKHGIFSQQLIDFVRGKQDSISISKTGSELSLLSKENTGKLKQEGYTVNTAETWINLSLNGAGVPGFDSAKYDSDTNTYTFITDNYGFTIGDLIGLLGLKLTDPIEKANAQLAMIAPVATPDAEYDIALRKMQILYAYRSPLVANVLDQVKTRNAEIDALYDHNHQHINNYLIQLVERDFLERHLKSGKTVKVVINDQIYELEPSIFNYPVDPTYVTDDIQVLMNSSKSIIPIVRIFDFDLAKARN